MEKKNIVVVPEYLNRSASRDEEHLKPLPAAKMFYNLRAAFEWSFQSELLGDYFGWHAPVYLVSGCKLILITKTTDKLIREEEIFEALEGLKASYYEPSAEVKSALNKVYGDAVMDKIQVAVYDIDGAEIDRMDFCTVHSAREYCRIINHTGLGTAMIVKAGDEK